MLRTLIYFAIAAVIIIWIVSQPAHAGDTVHSWISGIATFFSHVMNR